MMNQVVLIGRLTAEPELRYTPEGMAVANFTLAVQRNFPNKQGEYDTDFIDHTIWRKQAENVANHCFKGQLVATKGRLQVRRYETDDGQKRKVYEVVANNVQFLEYPDDEQQENQQKNDGESDIEVPF